MFAKRLEAAVSYWHRQVPLQDRKWIVEIQHCDGSFMIFRHAAACFYGRSRETLFVSTEHAGFHVFPVADLSSYRFYEAVDSTTVGVDLIPCPDCAVFPGEEHEPGCDVSRCSCCGGQLLSCGCEAHIPSKELWTGEWPGSADCREFGWYSKLVPGQGWVTCTADDPEAAEDMNRWVVWNRERKQAEKPCTCERECY